MNGKMEPQTRHGSTMPGCRSGEDWETKQTGTGWETGSLMVNKNRCRWAWKNRGAEADYRKVLRMSGKAMKQTEYKVENKHNRKQVVSKDKKKYKDQHEKPN